MGAVAYLGFGLRVGGGGEGLAGGVTYDEPRKCDDLFKDPSGAVCQSPCLTPMYKLVIWGNLVFNDSVH